MVEIIINESFSNEEFSLFEKLENKQFDSSNLLDLRVEADKISEGSQITELISYESIKKNLSYKLQYQIDGAINILRDFNGSALLADEVGLGKTITAGLVLKECIMRGFVKKVLILTPPSLVDQWVAELKEKFELDFKIIENESDLDNITFGIASMDRLKNYNKESKEFRYKEIHNISWDLVMVDEAHKLKEKNTVRWRFVDKLQKKRFLLLTATPFQNDLIELYNLLHLLKKGHLGTIKEFRKKFLNQGNKRYPLNPKELKNKLDEVMVRRRRYETGINYKKRIPKIVVINQTDEEKNIYNKICSLLKEKYFACSGREINARLILFALLPKITSSSKSAMESLERIANDEKYHKIKEFKENSQILISTDTGAEGLNLQFCYTLINYDLPWNPMSVEQRIGRLDRIGQEKDMNIYSFATKDTMEEYVVDLIINKMCCVGLVIGELPIILFNLGLDSQGKTGATKIEEYLLNSFIDSKNNLDIFARDIKEITKVIQEGMSHYEESKDSTSELLDEKRN